MKVQVASDLHREFLDKPDRKKDFLQIDKTNADVLLLAGDIDVGLNSLPWIESVSKNYSKVLYILGNHEFYHNDYSELRNKVKSYSHDRVVILDDSYYDFNGYRFVGSTYWTDMDNKNPKNVLYASSTMNDYKTIRYNGGRLKAEHTLAANEASKAFLLQQVSSPLPIVLMTHMALSTQSISPMFYSQGYVNHYYVSNHEDSVLKPLKPVLYVHGHTHVSHDYSIDKTRVLCNPYGYRFYSENPDFVKNLEVQLS